jgi:hypothetical protein
VDVGEKDLPEDGRLLPKPLPNDLAGVRRELTDLAQVVLVRADTA